jgi:putative transposase
LHGVPAGGTRDLAGHEDAETRFHGRRRRGRADLPRSAPFLYCLAFAAERTGVVLHACCVMSNHHHLVVTDTRGVLPDFLRELHRLTAKAMNASQGQWENLWAAEPCNAVRLVTDQDVEDKIAYVVSNPVAAGLVEQPEHWPGVLLWGQSQRRVTRPGSYFREDGTCPEDLSLVIEPPGPRNGRMVALREWRERVGTAIALKVAAAHRTIRQAGRAFLGKAAVLAASFIERARSYEQRFGVIPTFAAKARSAREELGRVERYFRAWYRRALEQWRGGQREVVFPTGTWGMVVWHGALAGQVGAGDG